MLNIKMGMRGLVFRNDRILRLSCAFCGGILNPIMLYYLYNIVIWCDTGDEEDSDACIISILTYCKVVKWIFVYIFGSDKIAGYL